MKGMRVETGWGRDEEKKTGGGKEAPDKYGREAEEKHREGGMMVVIERNGREKEVADR